MKTIGASSDAPVGSVNVGARPSAPQKLSYAEERERQALPNRIEEIENRITDLERQLADPDLYSTRGAQVPALVAELENARAEAEVLLARWEDLETRHERVAGPQR